MVSRARVARLPGAGARLCSHCRRFVLLSLRDDADRREGQASALSPLLSRSLPEGEEAMIHIRRPWLAPLLGLGGWLSLAVAALRANLARRTLVLALGVCIGSLLDALLTLGHLAHGGTEANPWLARALTSSTAWFLLLKMGLTGAGVWILVAHHQCPLAARGLNGVALVYGAVLVYHLLLYVRLV